MNFDNEKYKASINFKIKTYEIDAAGHVNNIVYVKWLEDLRCKLFEQILPIDQLLKINLYPVVVSKNIEYKKQLKLNDNPTGIIRIENIPHNMIFFRIDFLLENKICATAFQKCVLMNLKSGTMDKSKLKFLEVRE